MILLDETEDDVFPPQQTRRLEGHCTPAESRSVTFRLNGGDGLAKMSLLSYGSPPMIADAESRQTKRGRDAPSQGTPSKPQRRISASLSQNFSTPSREQSGSVTPQGSGTPSTEPKVVYKAHLLLDDEEEEQRPAYISSSPSQPSTIPEDRSPSQRLTQQSSFSQSGSQPVSSARNSQTQGPVSKANPNSSPKVAAPSKPLTKQMKLSDFFGTKK